MSTQIFRTRPDWPYPVDILGVGALGPNGKGGVPIEVAARSMSELQERDRSGVVLVGEDGKPKQFTGAKLAAAAKELADQRDWVIDSIPDDKVPFLPQEWGVPAPRPPAAETARAAGDKLRHELRVHRHASEGGAPVEVEAAVVAVPVPAPAARTESGEEVKA